MPRTNQSAVCDAAETFSRRTVMKQATAASTPRIHEATIHALQLFEEATAHESTPSDRLALEHTGEILAQAIGTLLRLQIGEADRAARGLASGVELSQLIDTFLAIRDAGRRRSCLERLRDFAMEDAQGRAPAG